MNRISGVSNEDSVSKSRLVINSNGRGLYLAVLKKQDSVYVFKFVKAQRSKLARTFRAYAQNESLDFSWQDAAVLNAAVCRGT